MAVLKYWDEDLGQWLPVAPGPKGLKGDKGDQGDQGVIGPTPSLSIGTVDTGAAAATITGTDEEPMLNLTLPPVGDGSVGYSAFTRQIGNLLTDNQATGTETLGDTTGFVVYPVGAAIASSTAQAARGTRSLKVTSGSNTCAFSIGPSVNSAGSLPLPDSLGSTVTVTIKAFAATVARSIRVDLIRFSDNSYLGTMAGTIYTKEIVGDWVTHTETFTIPAGTTTRLLPVVYAMAAPTGEVHYFDQMQVVAAPSLAEWNYPGVPAPAPESVGTVALVDRAVTPAKLSGIGNLLTDNQATGTEARADTYGFFVYPTSSCDIESSTAEHATGTRSLAHHANVESAAGFVLGTSVDTAGSIPLRDAYGCDVTVTVDSLAATTPAAVYVHLHTYNGGGYAGTLMCTQATVNSTEEWTTHSFTHTVPAGVTHVLPFISVTGCSGFDFYFDNFQVNYGPQGLWSPPGFVVNGTVADGSVTLDRLAADTLSALSAPDSDVTLTTGVPHSIAFPGGHETVGLGYQVQQHGQTFFGPDAVQGGGDDFGPIWVTLDGTTQLVGGNHRPTWWKVSAGLLTAAEIGKVWVNSTNRITLLDVTGGYAYFSFIHNDAVTVLYGTTPSGTWTCSGKPDVTFSSPASESTSFYLNRVLSDTGINWADGLVGTLLRRYVQDTTSYGRYILAQQASVGTKIDVEDAESVATYVTEWRWYGDQPAVTLVDVTYTAAVTHDVVQFSGLQMGNGGVANAVLGMNPGTDLVTWNATPAVAYLEDEDWADATFPPAFFTRNAYGGGALGILAASQTLNDAPNAGQASGKLYPSVIGWNGSGGDVTLTAGQSLTCRGWRSYSGDAHDRHFHIVTDPVTGITHWFLMAGSTGTATHPAIPRWAGSRLVTTRGTAVVDGFVGETTITVTTAGWAEGTIA